MISDFLSVGIAPDTPAAQILLLLSFTHARYPATVDVYTHTIRASSAKERERSWIDPDCRERSLTERFVPARALSFLGVIKNFNPSSFSHVTRVFVCKQTVISFGVLFVLKRSYLSFFMLLTFVHWQCFVSLWSEMSLKIGARSRTDVCSFNGLR